MQHSTAQEIKFLTKQQETSVFQWVRFVVGAVIFFVILGVHAWVKPFSDFALVALLSIPGALVGIDVKSMFGGKK